MPVDKVRFPGPGCLVEYLQGNAVALALVLEEQNGRLRLYGSNKREMALPASRVLPWSGPALSANFTRQQMDETLEAFRIKRETLTQEVDLTELWETVQGEADKASAEWLAGLVWPAPGVDHEAAMGRALLGCKTHFKFSPPDFEIYTQDQVEKRVAEAELRAAREAVAGAGSQFFRKLWDLHSRGKTGIEAQELPEPELAAHLKKLLFENMASPEGAADDPLWKQLVSGLPDAPHLALHLAVAWGIVPEHYNYLLDKAGFERGEDWIEPYADECRAIEENLDTALKGLPFEDLPFVSIDPDQAEDHDDAFFGRPEEDGGFRAVVALACPAVCWPFGGPLDKAVLRRGTSLYLPEGDEHMIPFIPGRGLFSLDAGKLRPCLVLDMSLSPEGTVRQLDVRLGSTRPAANISLEDGEALLVADSPDPANPQSPFGPSLRSGFSFAQVLQTRRIAAGAVITERPDPKILLTTAPDGKDILVDIVSGPETPSAHNLVSEIMILANAAIADWAGERGIALLHRTQDVAIPKDFAGIWTEPHEISRVVRALPPASLQVTAKRHAGLGLDRYAPITSPIRRYSDLLNQGQIVHYLKTGRPLYTSGELSSLLPLLSARLDEVAHIQRARPRYWKYLFFRRHGDKQWWDARVLEENEAFVFVGLPWAHLIIRARRSVFGEKLYPGQFIQVRIGKVSPLRNEISILEARED